VTGVQTCALPILPHMRLPRSHDDLLISLPDRKKTVFQKSIYSAAAAVTIDKTKKLNGYTMT